MESYYEESGHSVIDLNSIWVPDVGACAICKQPTNRVDINFECHVHDGECIDTLWNEYWEANRAAGPIVWDTN
jgi:hypothetical protein